MDGRLCLSRGIGRRRRDGGHGAPPPATARLAVRLSAASASRIVCASAPAFSSLAEAACASTAAGLGVNRNCAAASRIAASKAASEGSSFGSAFKIRQRGIGAVRGISGRRSGRAAPGPRPGCSPARRARRRPPRRRPTPNLPLTIAVLARVNRKSSRSPGGQRGSRARKELVVGRLLGEAPPTDPGARGRGKSPAHRATRRTGPHSHAPAWRPPRRPAPRRGARSPFSAPPPRPARPGRAGAPSRAAKRPPFGSRLVSSTERAKATCPAIRASSPSGSIARRSVSASASWLVM